MGSFPHTTEGVQLKKWETQIEKFSDLEVIKVGLSVDCNDYTRDCDFKFGYIQPHRSKGRQVPLHEPKDIEAMYEAYRGRKQVILWVSVKMEANESQVATKKQRGASTESSGSNYKGHLKTLSEVQVIVDELEKKYKDCRTPEQIRACGHMIHMKKHSSYDEPPQKPFYGLKEETKREQCPFSNFKSRKMYPVQV